MFEHVQAYPGDPILSLNEDFQKDPRAGKVNLTIGIYFDEAGRIPVMAAAREAEAALLADIGPRPYLPMAGLPAYRDLVQELVFGAGSAARRAGRIATVQTLGGSGALKVGADFLKRYFPKSEVWVSDPSWENHRTIFEGAGFAVHTYPYYDDASGGLRFDEMLATVGGLPAGSVVLLHACCHNPTGVDPTPQQWEQIAAVVKARNLVPFLDIAYQGFGEGLEQDAAVVRMFAALDLTMFISSSFSKSFSLYGERVGALTVVAGSKDEAARVLSQLKRVIRTNYSNPPTHGGTVVSTVLNTPELFALWENELAGMRDRIRLMRKELVEKIKAQGVAQDFSFVLAQRGMFSYSGLTATQVDRLREEHGIYAVSSGRICVAALNSRNIDAVAAGIAAVLK